MNSTKIVAVLALLVFLGGCGGVSTYVARNGPEKLVIYPDGSMHFHGKPIPARDVVIYPDGYGGEKAAVRVHMEPLHPDYFRDTIVVQRRPVPGAETQVTQN